MKILVIDDDPMTLELLKKGLSDYGHEVTTAENGYQALCVLEEIHFDFVLCDVFMPELSGLIVANLMKQYYDTSIPFLLMSSDKNVGNLIHAKFGADLECISKPIKIADLEKRINGQKKRSHLN